MPEETMWEVWVKYEPNGKWFLSMKFQDFKEAKSYYNDFADTEIEVRMIRAELHRAIVIEDLKGNVYE